MTTYRIEHRTSYSYDSDVTGNYGLLHLRPRDLAWQTCLAHEIKIEPDPADLFQHVDVYGNHQVLLSRRAAAHPVGRYCQQRGQRRGQHAGFSCLGHAVGAGRAAYPGR